MQHFPTNIARTERFPPPPPPPPPPPLPVGQDSAPETLEKGLPQMEGSEKRIPKSASAPSAHLFDSSQLVSARKKLRKTAEGLQRRRGELKTVHLLTEAYS